MAIQKFAITQSAALAEVLELDEGILSANCMEVIRHMHEQMTKDRPKSDEPTKASKENLALATDLTVAMATANLTSVNTAWVVDHVRGVPNSQKAVQVVKAGMRGGLLTKSYDEKGNAMYSLV